jgi:hypothetical protein
MFMRNRELRDLQSPDTEERREWQSFLGLVPMLDVGAVEPVLYQRCLAVVWRMRARGSISRADLGRHAGLDLELVMALLIRERVIDPILSAPFRFQIQIRNSTNPESADAADRTSALTGIAREEQAARFGILQSLTAAISNVHLPDTRAQKVKKQWDELSQIYEATWLELGDAIGSRSAEGVRRGVEHTCRAPAEQMELPLEEG